MKKLQAVAAGIALVLAVILTLHAQTAISIRPVIIRAPVPSTEDDLATMIEAVEQTTPVAAESAPIMGTFWSAQHNPSGPEPWPPLPGNLHNSPIWPLGDNTYLLDDENYDYNAPVTIRPGGGMHAMDLEGPPSPGDGGDGGTNTYYGSSFAVVDYGTNLWIAQVAISSGNFVGIVSNSQADILYEIQSKQDLLQSNWVSEGFLSGSEITNWTPMAVAQGNRTNLFLRIRSWVDSNNSGIPDWWWLTYFGQATNVDPTASAAGDGYSNLQKFQMGLNPTNYYNPNPPGGFYGYLDSSGTNVFLAWSNAPGPVLNYAIQRGILNTNSGFYSYSQIGLVSSNTTLFEDVGAITNANAQNNIYNLEAVYPAGSLSGTDTWQVSWISYGAGPPYGPPMPSNLYAYADVTGTNVLLSWTPAQGAATNDIILRGIYNPTNYDYDYTQIASVSTNTTSLELFGALTNNSNWTEVYEVEAVYPGGGLSAPASSYPGWPSQSSINIGSASGPAAPTNFYGYTDSTGTNVFLTWNSLPGAVTNYIIYGGVFDDLTDLIMYHQLGKTGSGTNVFEVEGGVDGSGNNLYYIYNVVAVYTNGSQSQSAAWYPGNGTPTPGTFSAYLDATGTNVMLAWSLAPGATGYLIQASGYYGESWSYTQIGDVSSTTTSFEDVDGADSGYDGLGSIVYEIQAIYPNGGISPAVTATVATNPPAPSGLSATVDSTGTNVSLVWSPAVGAVTGYTILRGTYNSTNGSYSYSQIGTVGASTTSFQDTGAISSNNGHNNIYEVEADYAGGSVSSPDSSSVYQPSPPPTYNLNVTAQMVRNQTGHWQLMFSSIPTNVQAIAFYWYSCDYFYGFGPSPDGAPLTTENDIPVGSITNGIYVLPDFLMTNWFPSDWVGKIAMVQPIGTNGEYGNLCQAGFQPDDSPCFVDGRQHLKQNLLFELRAATISQPNSPLSENDVWWNPFFINISIPADTNYVESSIFHWSEQFNGYGGYSEYIKMDDVWPITANYELHGNLYDTNSVTAFVWQPNLGDLYAGPNLSFQGTLASVPAPAVLGVGDPYWTLQSVTTYVGSPGTGLTLVYDSAITDLAAYTNSGSLFLQSGAHNLFGLSFTNAMVNEGGVDYGHYPYQTYPPISLSPGGSIALSNADAFFNPNVFFSQTADPSLQITNYYFAPINTPGTALPLSFSTYQPYPVPTLTGFANTNQTQVMIASVGNPIVIGGWAKEKILNGSSAKFGYLGQYFVTNAYFVSTNGTLTTNTTGVVSPYGDFFPTAPGAIAMITMPDIDTAQQGTGVVDVISLNVDANHNGTMDFSYDSPDFVSSSKPFRFWINDDSDSGDFGGDGIPGKIAPVADGWNYTDQYGFNDFDGDGLPIYEVHGTRDLADFFPVYLNIGSLFQSNTLSSGISVTDTNYQFVLSQADSVLRFVYTDLTPTNYMNFLQNTNEAESLAHAVTTTITAGGVIVSNSFLNGIVTANQGIILVEAAASTTQPLVLSIYHGSNLLAQTSLYLSISGVEQMFRHKNLILNTNLIVRADRLTDASVPNEPDTIDKNFVFVHGYNVNPDQARGWDADIFKRLYWSGSHAKFYGVTWEASDSQIDNEVTINLQTNIVNAFNTAPLLNSFLNSLSGTNIVVAHSLGNMVVLSALNDYTNQSINTYFMIDAAVAIEAVDSGASSNPDMYPSAWTNYNGNLWASDWYGLFPTNDYRSTLTWHGRLGNFQNAAVYNFYSSGEEVLRDYPSDPPTNLLGIAAGQLVSLWKGDTGEYTWAWQEKLKGLMPFNSILSSDHGGWSFNLSYYTYYEDGAPPTHMSPSNAASLPNSELQTNAFFDFTSEYNGNGTFTADLALYGSSGSAYAQTNRNRILSDAIPCLTLPVGANLVPRLQPPESPFQMNFDMQANYENGWPAGRPPRQVGASVVGEWHHSDVRAVAYTFTYKLFNQMVTVGNLQ